LTQDLLSSLGLATVLHPWWLLTPGPSFVGNGRTSLPIHLHGMNTNRPLISALRSLRWAMLGRKQLLSIPRMGSTKLLQAFKFPMTFPSPRGGSYLLHLWLMWPLCACICLFSLPIPMQSIPLLNYLTKIPSVVFVLLTAHKELHYFSYSVPEQWGLPREIHNNTHIPTHPHTHTYQWHVYSRPSVFCAEDLKFWPL
jgi:hypothetical protein